MGLLLLMGDSGFRGALDTLSTGLESAWSVGRRLRTGYTGNIIRVRRSNDNAESDFGYLASGAVDVAAVEQFCGANDGFITTIYEQSGLSRNLTQSTTTLQPVCVSSGVAVTQNGYLACSTTTAAARRMSVASSTSTYNFLHTTGGTGYAVHQSNDTGARKCLFGTHSSLTAEAGISVISGSTEGIELRACKVDVGGVSTNGASVLIADTALATLATRLNSFYLDPDNGTASARGTIWQNGVASTVANAATSPPFVQNAAGNFTLGAYPNGSIPFDGKMCELVIWSGDQTAGRTTWESSAKTFWGTP